MPVERDEVVKWVVMLHIFVLVLCFTGVFYLWPIDEHWRALMEAAHFADWPQVSGLGSIRFSVVGTSTLSSGIWLIHKRCQLKMLLAATSIALVFSAIGLYGAITLGCPAPEEVKALATQAEAVATFNRGVCLAWCHAHPELTVGNLCGEKSEKAFQSITLSSTSKVATWCEEAITYDSFAANASYSGLEPFTMATHVPEACVPGVSFEGISVIMGITVSVCLAAEVLVIEALMHKARSTTAASGSEAKIKASLVTPQVAA